MDCQNYQDYYYSYIEADDAAIPPECLEHIRSCPTCRAQIEHLEQSLSARADAPPLASHDHLALHFKLLGQRVDCTTIKPFLPCLATTALAVHVQTPVTAHLKACSACRADYKKLLSLKLTDAQLLNVARFFAADEPLGEGFPPEAEQVLSAIQQRPDADIVTVAEWSDSAAPDALHVRTLHPTAARTTHAWPRAFKTAAGLAAAVILVAVLLFFQTPPAGALDLRQFYDALAAAQNLSIQTTVPEESDPIQHIWISQTRGLRLFESAEKTTLVDLNAGETVLRNNTTGITEMKPVTTAKPDDLQLPWGLLPFRDVTQIADGFQWERLDTPHDASTVVYELSWTDTAIGRQPLHKKWVGYLDRTTHLPEKIEWYERFEQEASYRLVMTMTVTYPKDEVIIEAVRQSGLEPSYGIQR